jgi:hypothetical protein
MIVIPIEDKWLKDGITKKKGENLLRRNDYFG